MASYKIISVTLIIIIFGGIFMSALISPFVNVNDIEDNWVDDYGLSSLVSGTIKFLGTPFLILGNIFDLFSGPQILNSDVNITISGTGFHDGETMDGTYFYKGYAGDELGFKDDDGNWIKITAQEVDNVFIDNYSILYYNKNIFSNIPMYLSTGVNGTSDLSSITSWSLNPTYSGSYDFNPTATGSFNINEDALNIESSLTEKTELVVDNINDKVTEHIRTFGIIPEFIGLPLLLILILGVLFEIISLIRGA